MTVLRSRPTRRQAHPVVPTTRPSPPPPPARTPISQESRDLPIALGPHHRLNRSGFVHASNTMCAGASKVRVTTSSRSDFRSTAVRFFMGWGSLSFLASIEFLPLFQILDNPVQLVEARGPELAVLLEPCRRL